MQHVPPLHTTIMTKGKTSQYSLGLYDVAKVARTDHLRPKLPSVLQLQILFGFTPIALA